MNKPPHSERAKSLAARPKQYTTRAQDILILATLFMIAVAIVIGRIYG